MAYDADIPLHAAGDPGIAQGQVTGLEDRVYMQQLPPRLLVVKGPESSSKLRQEGGLQEFVLQDKGFKSMVTADSVIAILNGVGQNGVHPPPAHVAGFLRAHGGLVNLYLCVGIRY